LRSNAEIKALTPGIMESGLHPMQNAKFQDLTPKKMTSLFPDSVVFAYLFGSAARGEQTPFSDTDIAVYLQDGIPSFADEKLRILGCLTEMLKTDQVDLVTLNDAPLPLAARVLRHGKLILDRDPFSRHLYISLMFRKSFDFSHFEESILNRRFGIG